MNAASNSVTQVIRFKPKNPVKMETGRREHDEGNDISLLQESYLFAGWIVLQNT